MTEELYTMYCELRALGLNPKLTNAEQKWVEKRQQRDANTQPHQAMTAKAGR